MTKHGRARWDGKRLHFDAIGWAMVKKVAAKQHKSSKAVVIEALIRAAKKEQREKAKNA